MQNVINRSWKLGKLALSARALSKETDENQQRRARKALMQQFADARGVMMKVGQLIAAADEGNDELSPLITSIEPLPLSHILPAIESALGCDWEEVFKSIDESQAAASLGQVHRAVLLNNEQVAVKIQYPDIQKAIDAEMTILGLMPKAGPVKKWNFDLDGYRQALKQNMALELDYRHEARQQSEFKQNLQLPSVVIPRVYDDLSSETLLVQSWEDGVFLDQTVNWPVPLRKRIAETLLGLLLKSLFETRLLHADPHRGNSYFRHHGVDDIEMVLMDFGCTVELTEQQSLSLLKLMLATREKSSGLPINYFAAMGFDAKKLSQIESFLPKLSMYLFEPFLEDKIFHVPQWFLGKKITELLADERWWFRSAGPANLIFIMRAFQGLTQQLETLKVSINWWQVLTDVLSEDLLDRARKYECEPVSSNVTKRVAIDTIANRLYVKVTRDSKPLVEVNLPADAVLQLKMFIPEDVQEKLEETSDINIDSIINKVRLSGIAAQTVFDFDDGDRHYLIWLE